MQGHGERGTEMTIAFRVPILQNCCGPGGGTISTALMSSAGRRALRFTPV
jgi:hypothetical protein